MAKGRFSQPREQNYEQPYRQPTGKNSGSPDNKPTKKGSKSRKVALICVCAAALVLVIGIIAGVWYFTSGSGDDGLILNNVTVAGVNLGGMTKKEAQSALHKATDLTYTSESMIIYLPDTTLELTPADTGAQLDIDAAVEEAYKYGRTGTKAEREKAKADSLTGEHPIALLNYLNLDLEYIRAQLDDYGSRFNSDYTPSSVTLEGDKPELDASKETFNPEAPCQTLVLELGTPGRHLDIDKLYNQVLDAYSFNIFEVGADMSEDEQIPDEIDLEALYEQYCSEPVDAAMDKETYEVTPAIYGYGFDLEAAQAKLEDAVYGDTIEIQMEYILPEVKGEELSDLLFRDVLATCETDHTSDKNRNNNLTLACAAINGIVLEPGDTFDYNKALGKRTAENGYKAAAAYSGGLTVQELGGGICQVSSTLYYCTLVADLEIVERTPHSYVSSYIPMGMDATVSWGGPEFKFKNNTNYPIRIEAEVSDGKVKVKLIGTDEKDYYIKMEYEVTNTVKPTTETVEIPADNNPNGYKDGQVIATAYTGYTVKTYKCKYDKETNELISRDFDRTSTYKYRNKQIASIVSATEPTTEPTTAPTTPPETTAPTEAAPAPTEAPVTPTDPPVTPAEAPSSDSGVSEG
ncbi:MAG: VanW family protein [Oscillospiraceae bacterium]|nr:VanW family protein [Oscillospiraceae bacterium]